MTGHGPVGGRRGAYSPKALLSAVQRVHPSFRGYHQQDAHELFMRLVGTLEDEEDSFIKRRREEEKEKEEEQEQQEEEEGARATGGNENSKDNNDGSRASSASDSGGGEASRSDANANSIGASTPAESQAPERVTKPSTGESGNADMVVSDVALESAGSAGGKEEGVIATPGEEEKSRAAMVPDSVKTGGTPGEAPLPEGISATSPTNGDNGSVGDRATVTTCSDAPTRLFCASGEEKTCTRNGVANGHTADEKRSDGDKGLTALAGAELTEVTGVTGKSEDKVVLLGADHAPVGCASANGGEMNKKHSPQCGDGHGGGANADAETSTDDGKTTDASDQDDDDDDDDNNNNDRDALNSTVASSPPRLPDDSPDDSLAKSAEKDVAAVEADKEETGEHRDAAELETAVPVAPAFPQRAAVTEVFGGMMCSVVTCNSCGGRSFCTEPTICLSLEIPMKSKGPTKAALAFIAKKKAAAAAAKAAARAAPDKESGEAESGVATADSSSITNVANESGTTEPAPDVDEAADEFEGFELSAKERKKVARQERERKRLMEAEAKAEEGAGCDAAGVPGQQSDNSSKHTVTPLMERGQDAPKTLQDEGDEVRQCLEHVLSVCVAAADADGENGHETGVDSGAVVANQATSTSEVGLGEREEDAKEHNEVDRQPSIGAEASVSTEGEGSATTQRALNEGETHVRGAESRGTTEQDAPCTDALVEPEAATPADTATVQMGLTQSTEKPSARGDGPAAEVVRSETCGGGNGGNDRASGEQTSAPNLSPIADPASLGAETFTSSDEKDQNDDGQAPRSSDRLECMPEKADCNGSSCGCDPPPLECDIAGDTAVSGQDRQADARDGQKQQSAEAGLRNSIDGENDLDESRTHSSSDSLAGCTTGETRGSADLREGLGSAFGSECSEGNGNADNSEERTTPADTAFKCLGSSGASGTEVNQEACVKPPMVDSGSECVQESERTAEDEGVSTEEGQGSRSSGSGVVAIGEDGDDVRRASGATSTGEGRCGAASETAAAAAAAAAATTTDGDSSSTASQSPLDRLQEPQARVKPDRRHDPDGIDLYGCLDHFMAEEKLNAEDGNGYDCESCSSRSQPPEVEEGDGGGARAKEAAPRRQQNARKRLLMLGQPPGVLVCHLKRLQAKRKIIRSVEFPIELDMAPYFWRDPSAPLSPSQTRYRLTGLIQHRGSRLGGHYVAYVRDGEGWKHASDSAIRTATLPELKACEAYMLFYELADQVEPTVDEADEADESGVGGVAAAGDTVSDAAVVQAAKNADQHGVEPGGTAPTTEHDTAAAAEAGGEKEQQQQQQERDSEEGKKSPPTEGQEEQKGEIATSADESDEKQGEATGSAKDGEEEEREEEEEEEGAGGE